MWYAAPSAAVARVAVAERPGSRRDVRVATVGDLAHAPVQEPAVRLREPESPGVRGMPARVHEQGQHQAQCGGADQPRAPVFPQHVQQPHGNREHRSGAHRRGGRQQHTRSRERGRPAVPADDEEERRSQGQGEESLRQDLLLESDRVRVEQHHGRARGRQPARHPQTEQQRVDDHTGQKTGEVLRRGDGSQAAPEDRQQVDQERVSARPVGREADRAAAVGEVQVRPRVAEEDRRAVGDCDRGADRGGEGQHHEERPVGSQERPHRTC